VGSIVPPHVIHVFFFVFVQQVRTVSVMAVFVLLSITSVTIELWGVVIELWRVVRLVESSDGAVVMVGPGGL
jgi:hypothetical protein